jgi:hypothetical protein
MLAAVRRAEAGTAVGVPRGPREAREAEAVRETLRVAPRPGAMRRIHYVQFPYHDT